MSVTLYFALGTIALFGIMFYWFEKSNRFNAKSVAVIATASALAGAFRIPFAFLPNIQPTTFLVMCTGYVFGPVSGFISGAIATLVSNTFLGHGPWTPWQMLAWGLAGAYGGLIGKIANKRNNGKKANKKFNKVGFTMTLFVWGFLFDYIMNLWHFIFFIYPHTLRSFIAVYAASFLFDLSHAVGNAVFAWLFGEEIIRIFNRFKNKTIINDDNFERVKDYA